MHQLPGLPPGKGTHWCRRIGGPLLPHVTRASSPASATSASAQELGIAAAVRHADVSTMNLYHSAGRTRLDHYETQYIAR